MADGLPLLVFPSARVVSPPDKKGFFQGKVCHPGRARQSQRLTGQLDELTQDFTRYKAIIGSVVAGLEPETVLVIEIRGTVDAFKQAVDSTTGLEWLGEWDIDELEPDEEFHKPLKVGVTFFKDKIAGIQNKEQSKEIQKALVDAGYIDGEGYVIADLTHDFALPDHLESQREEIIETVISAKPKPVSKGRMFLSLANEQGLSELLKLWEAWEKGKDLPTGKAKWRDVFNQTARIRRWGIEETLRETGMIERWHDLLEPIDPTEQVQFQIELFYHSIPEKRRLNEQAISMLVHEAGGQIVSEFVDMPSIGFHSAKAQIPASSVREIVDAVDAGALELPIKLFIFSGIMYFRPTGQALAISDEGTLGTAKYPQGAPEMPPVAAILDGVPNLQHDALRERLIFDDPDGLAEHYQPGERRHGTSMASLIIHGESPFEDSIPLSSMLYIRPIMQPDVDARAYGKHAEHVPGSIFIEDLVERAVRRMIEGEGSLPPQAPTVKVVNISIGDPFRPFTHTPSPWARLLDWLSWKYNVLFCVSSGNYLGDIDIGMPSSDFAKLPAEEKTVRVIQSMEQQLSARRLLSPAESLNSLTIGALHSDETGEYEAGHRLDLMPSEGPFSPLSRFGHGFRRSVKPELLFPGGRQLYKQSLPGNDHNYALDTSLQPPGQQVAWDSAQEGTLSSTAYTRGTSNATALATRSAVQIHETLTALQEEYADRLPENLMTVLIKALLVHSASPTPEAAAMLEKSLKSKDNASRFREIASRHIGYGPVDIQRVLKCTEQRGTVLGCAHIHQNEIHEYRLPIPTDLSGRDELRRVIVTLAWFSPINPAHRNLREAKLEVHPAVKWDKLPLKLKRVAANHDQVKRGTVQHEILEGDKLIAALDDNESIVFHVSCKADATETLDEYIPYGLAVTLEVSEKTDIRVYQQIESRIEQQVTVGATASNLPS